jgi:hypothetical protein
MKTKFARLGELAWQMLDSAVRNTMAYRREIPKQVPRDRSLSRATEVARFARDSRT